MRGGLTREQKTFVSDAAFYFGAKPQAILNAIEAKGLRDAKVQPDVGVFCKQIKNYVKNSRKRRERET